uniref:Uncharacterized protein n=1 Tax=Vitis vinifera TaxID=29760 RepID=F6GYF8_VITVI
MGHHLAKIHRKEYRMGWTVVVLAKEIGLQEEEKSLQ